MKQAALVFSLFLLTMIPSLAGAHCDTVNGPVVAAGTLALEKGDLTPALHWVKPQFEGELRDTFALATVARTKGPEAKTVADRHFLETLVRLHRAGEGAAYEGIKPAGTDLTPAIAAADHAVDKGEFEPLHKLLANAQNDGLSARYQAVAEAKKHAHESVAAGRAYVAAYTEFVHYVEGVEAALVGGGAHHEAAAEKH